MDRDATEKLQKRTPRIAVVTLRFAEGSDDLRSSFGNKSERSLDCRKLVASWKKQHVVS